MRTVSLRRRVILSGVAVVSLMLVSLDLVVYAALRDSLVDGLRTVLVDRAQLARDLAGTLSAEELAERLADSGVGAEVRTRTGERSGRPARAAPGPPFPPGPPLRTPGFPRPPVPIGPPPRVAEDERGLMTTSVDLGAGETVTLSVSREGVDDALRRLAVIETLGTLAAIVLAGLLLAGASRRALKPLDDVVSTARRISGGMAGERLNPDRSDTELGRLARAFDEMLDALEDALASARASDERTKIFLADAAHQLRTPLAGIQASAEVLLINADPAEEERMLANIARESARAGRLIGLLLKVARLDRASSAERRTTDLVKLCRDEVERAGELAPGLEIRLAVPEIVTADVDEMSVREAIANLLDNACRHAHHRVDLTIDQTDTQVVIRVLDDGGGVSEELRTRVFERFVSLDGKGGSGLGLAYVRAVAQAHGGDAYWDEMGVVMSLPCKAVKGEGV